MNFYDIETCVNMRQRVRQALIRHASPRGRLESDESLLYLDVLVYFSVGGTIVFSFKH